jgi:preprotein translocase subunit SecA
MLPYLDNALRAKEFYRNEKEYVVRDGEIIIVDEFTGG